MANPLESGSANLEAMDAAKTYQAAMTRLLVRKMALSRGVVLDYGAGTGTYTRLAAQMQPGWQVRALEPNRALHAHYGPGLDSFSSLEDIEPASLDGAFSLNVFEHIPDDLEALRKLAARCKRGTPIFILVPAHMSLWSPMDDLVGHVRRYGRKQLELLARSAGLHVIESGWFDGAGYIATQVYRNLVRMRVLAKADGTISSGQVVAFDRVFAVVEPVIRAMRLPLGKNCWVRLQTRL